MPGILRIRALFEEFFCICVRFRPDTSLRRCIPDIFIPGMFIPAILLRSCFLPLWFLRVAFLGFRDVAFDLGLGFDLLIPGMLVISCCARTGTLATRTARTNKNPNRTRGIKLSTSPLIISPQKVLTKEDNPEK